MLSNPFRWQTALDNNPELQPSSPQTDPKSVETVTKEDSDSVARGDDVAGDLTDQGSAVNSPQEDESSSRDEDGSNVEEEDDGEISPKMEIDESYD